MKNCNQCGTQVSDSAAFCPYCGAKFTAESEQTCPVCGTKLKAGQVFCSNCGSPCTASDVSQQEQTQTQQTYRQPPQSSNTAGFKLTGVGMLTFLALFCCFFLVTIPVGIYGIYCASKAPKASSKAEGDAIIRKGTNACLIAAAILFVCVFIVYMFCMFIV